MALLVFPKWDSRLPERSTIFAKPLNRTHGPRPQYQSIDFLKSRVDKTLSVQKQIAATWTWPLKTTTDWEGESVQLDKSQPDSLAAKAIAANTRAGSARGQLDKRLEIIHDHTLIMSA